MVIKMRVSAVTVSRNKSFKGEVLEFYKIQNTFIFFGGFFNRSRHNGKDLPVALIAIGSS